MLDTIFEPKCVHCEQSITEDNNDIIKIADAISNTLDTNNFKYDTVLQNFELHNKISTILGRKIICYKCFLSAVKRVRTYCRSCGSPIRTRGSSVIVDTDFLSDDEISYVQHCSICDKIKNEKRYYEKISASIEYSGAVRSLLKKMKYQFYIRGWQIVDDLVTVNGEYLNFLQNNIDYITIPPTHWRRKLTRYKHPAYIIATNLSKRLNIPFDNRLLERPKHTEYQSRLHGKGRVANIKGAFRLHHNLIEKENYIKGKSILLIDDIMTTGSTINECAKILHKEGKVDKIYCFALFV